LSAGAFVRAASLLIRRAASKSRSSCKVSSHVTSLESISEYSIVWYG
jgi:hypothetical protein